ncbi:Hypothetical predicted protein [Mytilus galloprovincialis]|uniref:Novel STAND NTPase 3 domain-containing protein n=1 Tax=Mytilus galloprovincialis TaxID=29158 RepID=A0A8B6GTU6_MYTGA|nr:Hypothetical predicted protein [Mytilus galloprovincialis]
MTEPTEPRPMKRTIPPDLQRQVEELQAKVPKTTGPQGDLDEENKRWLIVGICLHSIISPILRKYADPILRNLYNSLVSSDTIDTQGYNRYLRKYPATNRYFLNYESINNNRNVPKKKINNKLLNDYQKYDYKVTSHVDLSKLVLQPNMAHYSGIDDSCDLSALLGLIINISSFQAVVQSDAEKIRTEIRNPWAHCEFREWTTDKYTDSFKLMGQLVQDIGLSNRDENRILGELNTWATNGQHFLSGTPLGLEIVGDIRQHTHILSEYVQTLCSKSDSEFIRVQEELTRMENDLQERMTNLESKTKEQDEKLEKVKKQVEDHIPQHIRANHGQEIAEWEQDKTTFLETRATRHLLESLPIDNCIIVTGSSGCGKSSNIHHAALHLRDSFGYEIIPVLTGPTDIINYYNKNKKQVFVVDDICGKETINTQTLKMWRDYSEKIEKILKVTEKDVASKKDKTVSKVSNPKLLLSCRLHIYKESEFQRIALFTNKECNLLSPELCLQEGERMHMLQKYLPADIINKVKQVTEDVDYFPLLCKLSKDKTTEEVKNLFTAPLTSIKKNINNIINENKKQFCALSLCIIFNDGFNTDWLKKGSVLVNKTDSLEDIVKEFDINLRIERQRNSLKACFSTLNGTYLRLRDTGYRMIHDKIYKITSVICAQHLTEWFIKYAPTVFIRDNFIFESVTEVNENDDLIVLLKDQEEDYFERLLCDLTKHVIISTFNNYQLIYQTFRQKLISFLKRKNDANTVLTKLDTDGCKVIKTNDNLKYPSEIIYYTTPLIESAIRGYLDIVHFLIVDVICNVNKADSDDNSPLYKASERGHRAVAEFLLAHNANVSQCNKSKQSPLYIACKGGHTDTAELLLQNNADVNQCDKNGDSPLYVACEGGYTDIAELLLQNYADVHQCDNWGKSSIYIACEGGHKNTVKLLLQNNADVSQCTLFGDSPWKAACQGGHTEIAKLLLKSNAHADKFDESGNPPLYVACYGGHKETVELLLQINLSDVSKCTTFEESPLKAACEGGHTEIVKLLLQNHADASHCNVDNESPLYEACKKGYTDIVEMLLQTDVDIFQCKTNEKSPLYVACKGGYKDIVKLLLQNNINVSQCNSNGNYPLYAACKRGYTDIVKLLLQNDADESYCSEHGNSPLYAACKGGYTDIVKLLLQNDHDVSLCNIGKESPLFAACLGGHRDTVELLLQNGADVSQCNEEDESPLYMACGGGYRDIVELLLQNNADISQYDASEQPPLLPACRGGYRDIAELLLQHNAIVNQCDWRGEFPLCVACEVGHIDVVKLLLQNNADVNQCDRYGKFPLYVACARGYEDIVELLLQKNANVNQCNSKGESPLHAVCHFELPPPFFHFFNDGTEQFSKRCIATVKILLAWKADTTLRNKNGQTPLDIVPESKLVELVNLWRKISN